MMDQINIVAVSDDQYAEYLAVMLTSILINKKSGSSIFFYIIDCGMKDHHVDMLANLVRKHQYEIQFIHGDDGQYKDFHVHNHISHAAYAKLQMPSLLKDLHKVIYLDCDLVVLDDIYKLWCYSVKDTYLYAAGDPKKTPNLYINVPVDKDVFNSGVMIINLDRWRDENVEGKAFNFLKENSHKLKLHDQAAFNAVLYDKWLPLDAKWNVQSSFYYMKNSHTIYDISEITGALQKPSIVHFTTNSKPWQFRNAHPCKKIFLHYYEKEFGRKPEYRDVNVISFLKRMKEEMRYRRKQW